MIPTSYTEADLAAFMAAELGAVGKDLGVTVTVSAGVLQGDFREPVNDVLLAYGTNDISTIDGSTDISKIGKLRALAKVQAWRLAQSRAAALYDFADGTQVLKRSQIFPQIEKALDEAISEAGSYVSTAENTARIQTIHWVQDPYSPVDPRTIGLL